MGNYRFLVYIGSDNMVQVRAPFFSSLTERSFVYKYIDSVVHPREYSRSLKFHFL